MPKNIQWILCFDFETDTPDPDTANIVELAAVPIHPSTLEIMVQDHFSIKIKPPNIDQLEEKDTNGNIIKAEYWTSERKKTLQWHAETRKTSEEAIASAWRNGVEESLAWNTFIAYCKKYNTVKKKGNWHNQPIPMGYNINGFDIPIVDKLCDKYGTASPFSGMFSLDVMQNLWWWLSDLEEPDRYSMDTMRKFFGLNAHGQAHEALSDVIDTAKIGVKFLKYHRKQASVDKFKNSFANQ